MPHFTHEGRTLHFLDEGEGDPVLLLHAFPLSAEQFRPQLDALARSHRLLVPDLRGFGESPLPDADRGKAVEMTDFADDALALLDHLAIPRAIVGGVSMGGYVAMALLRADPSRVRALVLSDTQLGADDEAGRQRREDTARAVDARGMIVLEETMMPRLLAQPPAPEVDAQVRALLRAAPPEAVAAASRGMGLRSDSRDILARFAGPLLAIVGAQDPITPVARARELADAVSGGTLVEIPGAGHLPNLERPELFNEALGRFLVAVRP